VSNASSDLLVLGIGSPFGADRVAWEVVDRLRGDPRYSRLRLETADRPGAGLATYLQGVRAAILFDALLSDAPPGSLHRLHPAQLAPGDRTSNHGFGVADALALGRALGILPPRLALVGIAVAAEGEPVIDLPALHAMMRELMEEMVRPEG